MLQDLAASVATLDAMAKSLGANVTLVGSDSRWAKSSCSYVW